MENRRIILYFLTALFGILLWIFWQKEHPANEVRIPKETTHVSSETQYIPHATNNLSTVSNVISSNLVPNRMIQVKTDLLSIKIDPLGGNLIEAKLLHYPVSLKETHIPITILTQDPANFYQAQSGISTQSSDLNHTPQPILYQVASNENELKPGQEALTVQLKGHLPNGVEVTKNFVFQRNQYAILIDYELKNLGNQVWQGNFYQQIERKNFAVNYTSHTRSYTGAAISTPQHPYEKLSFKKLKQEDVSQTVHGGWVAMQQQYFLSAWIPNSSQENHYYSHVLTPVSEDARQNIYVVGYLSPPINLAPQGIANYQTKFYVGPELGERLKALAPGLDLTIDYGWLWFLAKPIFWLMQEIYFLVGNWGWSIVLVTLLIKLLFYGLSAKSYRSMAKMRDIQPRLQALKDRYGDDKQGLSKAMMEFYKKEKINPMGGCLPMVVQIPVFFALYYVLIETVQLRQAPFIFWIHDLSAQDPYYVLPILMGLSMLLQQRLSPPPPDPTQAKLMMLLPAVFTVFFLTFPSGLVLYWFVNNITGILQQWYVMKTYHGKVKGSQKENQSDKNKGKPKKKELEKKSLLKNSL